MKPIDQLAVSFRARLPIILQSEVTECGLACLAMMSNFLGNRTDISTLRTRFPNSLRGISLNQLMVVAAQLGLGTRAVKVDLNELRHLHRPCILHWNFDHFVVLRSVHRRSVVVHDPARGIRRIGMPELSNCFTGVALELWTITKFAQNRRPKSFRFSQLITQVRGIYSALGQVLILALALEVFAILTPIFLQWVIDQAITAADIKLLNTLAIGFSLVLLLQAAIGAVRSWVIMAIAAKLAVQWKSNVLKHLISLPIRYFERRHLGDLVSRFGGIDQIQGIVTSGFVEAIVDGFMSATTLAVMALFSWRLSVIAFAGVALYGCVRVSWYRALLGATASQVTLSAKQQSHFLESMRGIRAIKLFQRESERLHGWLSLLVDQLNASLYTQKLQIIYSAAHNLLVGAVNIVVVWFAARMVMSGEFTVGMLIAFTSYNTQFNSRITGLIDKTVQFKLLSIYGERLSDITASEPESRAMLDPHGESLTAELTPTVDISDLWFRYSEGEPYILKGIELHVDAGESVAISGPSGCGKSTLLHVLVGARPASSGQVAIGGIPLTPGAGWKTRALMASVMQDDVLFSGSLSDNISFFDPHYDPAWIEECAKLARIHSEIVAMPMGYSSLIGDMGCMLSGGQRQRLLLARALYKRPKVLVLDEATSHLDYTCEASVISTLKSLAITRVVVAHREETIRAMDRHITLGQGRVGAVAASAGWHGLQTQ